MSPCRILALNDDLFPDQTEFNHATRIARIRFGGSGLDGSTDAALSYEIGLAEGYVWMVDVKQNRDCKGWWRAEETGGFSWAIQCPDGFEARGEISTPASGSGTGSGVDSKDNPVTFAFGAE